MPATALAGCTQAGVHVLLRGAALERRDAFFMQTRKGFSESIDRQRSAAKILQESGKGTQESGKNFRQISRFSRQIFDIALGIFNRLTKF